MAKSSPKKGVLLGHRDRQRTGIAHKLIGGKKLDSNEMRRLFYDDVANSSFHRTYKRDREALEAEGLILTEIRSGTSKAFALADDVLVGGVTKSQDESFVALGTMMRPLVEDSMTPDQYALGSAIARIALSTCGGPAPAESTELNCDPDVLHACAAAMQLRKPVTISYKSLEDEAAGDRVLRPYGIFTLEGNVYVVGERSKDGAPDAVRTYNLSRADEVQIRQDAPTYQIPDGFDLSDWPLKPFEIGAGVPVTIYACRDEAASLKANAPKRGEVITKQGGAAEWHGLASDLRAAASWCIQYGFLPLEPEQFVSEWQSLLEEV